MDDRTPTLIRREAAARTRSLKRLTDFLERRNMARRKQTSWFGVLLPLLVALVIAWQQGWLGW